VSRRHAIVRRDWNEITVEDAGSKNGVVLNERRITKPMPLRDADEIMLGAMKLTFIDPSAKFLGKLDDIPAFQEQPPSSEDDPDVGQDEPLEDSIVGEEAPPPPVADDAPAPMPSPVTAVRQGGTLVQDPNQVEGDPFGDIPPTPRGVGVAELALIVLAVVAVIGLAVAVALLFSNG
jgi:hypothetical protein